MTLDELIATHAATCPECKGTGKIAVYDHRQTRPCFVCADRAAAMRAAWDGALSEMKTRTVGVEGWIDEDIAELADELAAATDKATEGET